jgi:dienelactone hydrolase
MSLRFARWRLFLRLVLTAAGACLALLALFLVLLAWQHSQLLALPAPGGPYPVGRLEQDWTDGTRPDPLAELPGQPRRLAVWIWYPAAPVSGESPAPYFPPAWALARDQDQGIGILIEREPLTIQSQSYENAPLSTARPAYPVLIFQPGMGPSVPDYTLLAESLASQGYVVVGLNPTYTSNLVVFADGRVVTRSAQGAIPDSASPEEADRIGSRLMTIWAADVHFAIDHLSALEADPASPFYQRLDLDRLGIWGHSFGGATAIYVCQRDTRCKAGADLDGTPFSLERNAAIPVPFLLLNEDQSQSCDLYCQRMRQMAARIQPGPGYDLSVSGAGHFNFSDLPLRQSPLVRPLFRLTRYTGSIDALRGEQLTATYLLAFFDQSLNGNPSELLQGPSVLFPEVQFK